MKILYSCNDGYIPQTDSSLISLFENNEKMSMNENQNNKFLCLVDNPKDYGKVDGVEIYPIYTAVNKFIRALRYWHHKSNFKLLSRKIWLGQWKHKIRQYSQIVIFDSMFDYFPLEYIRSLNPDCKIHFCFRNRVKSPIGHSTIEKNPLIIHNTFKALVYSYNIDDCRDYSLRYYTQFHTIPKRYINCDFEIKRDVYFIGKDKGRLKSIKDFAKVFEKASVTYLFEIVPDKHKKYLKSDLKFLVDVRKYDDILRLCKESRCILEIVGNSNSGITYRAIESIILKKKLITNYQKIIESEIYDPDNMFVLGYDNANTLIKFIQKPFVAKDNTVKIKSFRNFILDLLKLNQISS